MIIKEILGNISSISLDGLELDPLELEWFETSKRIQSKLTCAGTEISIKFFKAGQRLSQGDILFKDTEKAIVVHIKACEAIVITPVSMLEMGTVCYEIGNKHVPIFIQNDQIMIPFEEPLLRWLDASGYRPIKEMRQLKSMLKSTDASHGHAHAHDHETLFTKITNLASKYSHEK